MNAPKSHPRPMNVIEAVWRDYRRWALTARKRKADQDRARQITLWLGLAGAALATVSSQLGDQWQWVSMLSATSIALAAFFGRELLTPEKETDWAKCRMLAEALQRQAWLALMQVPPYHDALASERLASQADELAQGARLSPDATVNTTDKSLPEAASVDEYIDQRLEKQIAYYRDTAAKHQQSLKNWRRVSFVLGGLAVLLGVIGSQCELVAAWVPVVTSLSAAVLSIVQSGRYQSLLPLYQQTARQLELVLAQWRDSPTKDVAKLILEAEDIMSRENESWRTEWLAKAEAADKEGKQSDEQPGSKA